MTNNSDKLDLKWTAGVEATLHQGTATLWQGILSSLGQTLSGRAPVYKIQKGTNRFSVFFGVEGDAPEVAERNSKTLIIEALGNTGLGWVSVECLSVHANEVIDQDIARIDEFGHMRPEADIIPFVARPNDK